MPEEQRTRDAITSIYEPVQAELAQVGEMLIEMSNASSFDGHGEMLRGLLSLRGKQIRPTLTLLASKFHPHDPKLAVLMATGVELLHIATLVHDDTVDEAEFRRGRPTVSSLWGRNVAVLLGDYVFAKSATYVCDTGNVRVMRRFAETIMALSAGELREYLTSFDAGQTQEQYESRIGDKTASLFQTASESGAVLSGASEEEIAALSSYGWNLGMAYQVADDILDFEGSEETVGKPLRNDLRHGVMTLPAILLARERPNEGAIQAVFDHRNDTDKLDAAFELIQGSPAIKQAYTVARDYCDRARSALDIFPDVPAKASLLKLCDYAIHRGV